MFLVSCRTFWCSRHTLCTSFSPSLLHYVKSLRMSEKKKFLWPVHHPTYHPWLSCHCVCVSLCLRVCCWMRWSTLLKACFVCMLWRGLGNVNQILASSTWLYVITFSLLSCMKSPFYSSKDGWVINHSVLKHNMFLKDFHFTSCSNPSLSTSSVCACVVQVLLMQWGPKAGMFLFFKNGDKSPYNINNILRGRPFSDWVWIDKSWLLFRSECFHKIIVSQYNVLLRLGYTSVYKCVCCVSLCVFLSVCSVIWHHMWKRLNISHKNLISLPGSFPMYLSPSQQIKQCC